MNKTIRVKIVTPNNTLFDGEALMVTLPGTAGELGVLPEHTLLLASLKEGLVKISLANPQVNMSQESTSSREFVGDTELKGESSNVREDSSLGSTHKLPAEINKKSIDKSSDYITGQTLKFLVHPGIAEITATNVNIVTDFASEVTNV